MKHDITEIEDIQLLVNTFYGKIQADQLLGPIFMERIKEWPAHLERMYSFWETLLLDNITYMRNSYEPHKDLPVDEDHFNHWLSLWRETVDSLFEGEKATEAKSRAEKIGMVFWAKISYTRSQGAN